MAMTGCSFGPENDKSQDQSKQQDVIDVKNKAILDNLAKLAQNSHDV